MDVKLEIDGRQGQPASALDGHLEADRPRKPGFDSPQLEAVCL